ncbi:hypothetical protein MKW92_037533 [Papaver armeniacum]|nr:hypothetical protein MKW92_037533 [Papaver armeniacum]
MAILKVHCFLIVLIVMVGFVTSRNIYCCAAVRLADVQCLLKYVRYMEGIITREKLVYVNKYCNKINTGHYEVHV